MANRLSATEREANKQARRIESMAHSALRFVQDNDWRRGCRIASSYTEAGPDLERIARLVIAEGQTADIRIPREIARRYLAE